jgi:hypothetical protein
MREKMNAMLGKPFGGETNSDGYQIPNPEIRIPNPASRVLIPNPESGCRSRIPNPGCPESRIQGFDTDINTLHLKPATLN